MIKALCREPPSRPLLNPLAAGELRGLAGAVRVLHRADRAADETAALAGPGGRLPGADEDSPEHPGRRADRRDGDAFWSCKTWRGSGGPISQTPGEALVITHILRSKLRG